MAEKHDDKIYTTKTKFLIRVIFTDPLVQFALIALALCCIFYFASFSTKEEITFNKKIETYGYDVLKVKNKTILGFKEDLVDRVFCNDRLPFKSIMVEDEIILIFNENKWLISTEKKELYSKNELVNYLNKCLPKLDKAHNEQVKINESWK